jgi:excisionase family DNA binding protein
MDVRDAAKRLEIGVSTVYALCHNGRLRHARIGLGRGVIRISEADLEVFLRDCRAVPSGRPRGRPGVE